MEMSELTICREDVILLSDTDTKDVNSHKNKKHKRKPKCIRTVKLATKTETKLKRPVPYCCRERCRSGKHYRRQTAMNKKYWKRGRDPTRMKNKMIENPVQGKRYKSDKNDDTNQALNRDLCSPITVASTNTYENVSSCSFNILSSDSDELEDLIKSTRKRMKNNNENFESFPIRKSICAATSEQIYQNISSDEEIFNNSIHSMDTILLYNNDAMAPCSTPEHISPGHLKIYNNNNNVDLKVMCDHNTNELLHENIPKMSREKNINLSPLYEISGKVFMEHYLNTSYS